MKKEVESQLESEKWQRIASGIDAKCGGKYPPAALQKKFKQLNKNNSSAVVIKDED